MSYDLRVGTASSRVIVEASSKALYGKKSPGD